MPAPNIAFSRRNAHGRQHASRRNPGKRLARRRVALEETDAQVITDAAFFDVVIRHGAVGEAALPSGLHHRPTQRGVLAVVRDVLVEAAGVVEGAAAIEDVAPFEEGSWGLDLARQRPVAGVRRGRLLVQPCTTPRRGSACIACSPAASQPGSGTQSSSMNATTSVDVVRHPALRVAAGPRSRSTSWRTRNGEAAASAAMPRSCRRASCCRRSRPRSGRAASSGTPARPADARASAAGSTSAPPPQRRRTSRCLHHPQPARQVPTQRSDNTQPRQAMLRKCWLQWPGRSLTSSPTVLRTWAALSCAPRRSTPRSITSAVYSQVGWASARASPRRRSSPTRVRIVEHVPQPRSDRIHRRRRTPLGRVAEHLRK